MKRSKALREQLKRIYKHKKKIDVQVGMKKNDLVQALHLQSKLPDEKKDKEVIDRIVEGLKEISKSRRLRDDFPSFAKFYSYVVNPKNGFTLEDIKEL